MGEMIHALLLQDGETEYKGWLSIATDYPPYVKQLDEDLFYRVVTRNMIREQGHVAEPLIASLRNLLQHMHNQYVRQHTPTSTATATANATASNYSANANTSCQTAESTSSATATTSSADSEK